MLYADIPTQLGRQCEARRDSLPLFFNESWFEVLFSNHVKQHNVFLPKVLKIAGGSCLTYNIFDAIDVTLYGAESWIPNTMRLCMNMMHHFFFFLGIYTQFEGILMRQHPFAGLYIQPNYLSFFHWRWSLRRCLIMIPIEL